MIRSLPEPTAWRDIAPTVFPHYPDSDWQNLEWRHIHGNNQREIWQAVEARTGERLVDPEGEARFFAVCPPIYRQTDAQKIPARRAFEKVLQWQFGPTGLVCIGPSRQGKTRAAWALIRRLFSEGRRGICLDPLEFRRQVTQTWMDEHDRGGFLDRLATVEFVFLDDIDKLRLTDAAAEALYTICERRPANQLPTIFTLNTSGPELAARMGDGARGVAIVERLREFCQVVNFTEQPNNKPGEP